MDVKDITDYFAVKYPDMGIRINDFTRPEVQKWQKVYSQLACDILLISQDILKQGVGLVGVQLDYPDLHENSMYLIRLLHAMSQVANTCNFEFDLTDILEPKQKRLQRMCASIIRYVEFRESKWALIRQIKKENEVRLSQYYKVTTENEENRKRINALRFQRSSQEPEIARLKGECEKQSNVFTALELNVADKKKSLTSLKSDLAAAETKLETVIKQMRATQEESERLDELIVPAPEMLKVEMCQLKEELDDVARAKKEKSMLLTETRQKQDYFEKYHAEILPMIERARAIEKQLAIIKQVKGELNRLTLDRDAQLQELRDIGQHVHLAEEKLAMARDKLLKLEVQGEAKLKARRQDIDNIVAEMDALRVRQAAASKANDKYSEEQRLIRKQASDVDLQFHNLNTELQELRRELDDGLEMFNEVMRTAYDSYLRGSGLPPDAPSPILPKDITRSKLC